VTDRRTRDGTVNLDSYIHPKNSCEFDMNSGERGGIRIKILMDYIYVHKKEANGDVSFQKCLVNQIRDPYFHHLAVVSNNQNFDNRISNIDVESIAFKNFDPKQYQDKAELSSEKAELIAKKNKIQALEDGTYHPQDLMSHSIREHLEAENRRAITFLKKDDEKLDILFKHYEMLKAYQHAFIELQQRAKDYRREEHQEAHFAIKTSELGRIQDSLNEIKERAVNFNN